MFSLLKNGSHYGPKKKEAIGATVPSSRKSVPQEYLHFEVLFEVVFEVLFEVDFEVIFELENDLF